MFVKICFSYNTIQYSERDLYYVRDCGQCKPVNSFSESSLDHITILIIFWWKCILDKITMRGASHGLNVLYWIVIKLALVGFYKCIITPVSVPRWNNAKSSCDNFNIINLIKKVKSEIWRPSKNFPFNRSKFFEKFFEKIVRPKVIKWSNSQIYQWKVKFEDFRFFRYNGWSMNTDSIVFILFLYSPMSNAT